jgi:hypothetical protein
MVRKAFLVAALALVAGLASTNETQAQQPQAYGQAWGGAASNRDYQRFNHYPYVYYPQNFYGSEYYKSSDSLYHRYPAEMQIPVYNRKWYNYYPTKQRYLGPPLLDRRILSRNSVSRNRPTARARVVHATKRSPQHCDCSATIAVFSFFRTIL